MTSEDIMAALDAAPMRFDTETQLQKHIHRVLVLARVRFSREVRLSKEDRIDFLLSGGLGIEVKIKGSLSDVTRQLGRYAKSNDISSLLLVTTKARHLQAPRSLNGKHIDIYFASVRRAF